MTILAADTRIVPLHQLHPYPGNARRGDLDTIKQSLEINGQYRPIVTRPHPDIPDDWQILAGHHTHQAAQDLGWPELAITVLPDTLTEDDARRIVIVDNRTNDLAGYDTAALDALLAQFNTGPDQTLELAGTGYTLDDYADLQATLDLLPTSLPDTPAQAPKKRAKTKTGDIITLGPHRLYCGDSRDPNSWTRLMEGDQAQMLWTDPPYGVDLHDIAAQRGRDHGDMAGDTINPAALLELATAVFRNAAAHTRPGGAFYVAHADTVREPVHQALTLTGWRHAQTLIWVKDSLVLGRQDYQWRHEPILYGWREGAAHHWHGGRTRTTIVGDYIDRQALENLDHADLVELVTRLLDDKPSTLIRVARPRVAEEHPTSKPAELIAAHILANTPPQSIVLDPFAGSGSTLIACEQTGRHARLIELERTYCDVIIDRYREHTGEKTTVVRNG